MRKILWVPALLVGLSVAWAGEPARKSGTPGKDSVEQLIKKLNSDKFAERERATAALEKLGAEAYDALKKAASAKDVDQETRSRAEKILAKIGQKVESAAVLAPTKLRLECKDTPVTEAVKQLAQKSGYQIAVQGDTGKLADRKVTFDTGETTFWQAFDRLCKEGGLVQVTNPHGGIRFGNPPGINPGGPIQIQPLPVPLPPVKAVPGRDNGAAQAPQRNDQAAEARAARADAFAQAQVQVAQRAQAQAQVVVPAQRPGGQAVAPPPPPIAFPVVQPGFQPAIQPIGAPGQIGQIIVTDGKAEDFPTHYAGALRFRLVPHDRNTMSWIPAKGEGESLLILEVCAEPKLAGFHVSGSARVDKAADDQGQALSLATDPMPNPAAGGRIGIAVPQPMWGNPFLSGTNRALVPVRLKRGEKQAKSLKELAGSVTAECVVTDKELVAIDDVLKAAGKSAKGKDGGAMELVEINKQDNGQVRVKVRMEMVPGANPFGGAIGGAVKIMPAGGFRQIQIGGPPGMINSPGLPSLLDAKGKAYQLVQIPAQGMAMNNNVISQEVVMIFRPQEGQGDPARLVLSGRRNATVQASFRFANVPLP